MLVRFSFPFLMGFCKTRAAFTLPEPLKARDILSFRAKRNECGRTLSVQPTKVCWSAGCSTCHSNKEGRFKLQLIRTEQLFPCDFSSVLHNMLDFRTLHGIWFSDCWGGKCRTRSCMETYVGLIFHDCRWGLGTFLLAETKMFLIQHQVNQVLDAFIAKFGVPVKLVFFQVNQQMNVGFLNSNTT